MSPLLGFAIVATIAYWNQEPPKAPPTDRIVLLPGEDGKVGKVSVKTGASEHHLTTAYAGAEVGVAGAIDARTEDADSVKQRYGAVLAARPMKPVSFVVNFVSGRNELTPESAPVLAQLKAELARRPAPEIAVIGHTDRVGKLEANDALSIKRAEAVRSMLVNHGIPASSIEASGRGEREPLVPTADEVAEAKNRRVEISVR